MVSTFTANIQLEEPARGDDVGTWDTPVNSNMTALDLMMGGITTISGAAGSVVLAAAQFQCKTLTFNSTLLASITVTFPTSFKKSYEVQNACTGSSAFVITLQTTVSGGQAICVPPGETTEFFTDGTNVKYKNLSRVGSWWDYAGSSVPNWVSGCTVPPYLNCDGTTFSSGTYPALLAVLGSTTLPDFRGRLPAFLNQTTGRLTTAGAGVDGNTNYANGGNNGVTLAAAQIPQISGSGTTTGGNLVVASAALTQATGPSPAVALAPISANLGNVGVTVTAGTLANSITPATVPVAVGGLRLIRAG